MSSLRSNAGRGAILALALLAAVFSHANAQDAPQPDAAQSAPTGCAAFKWPLVNERKAFEDKAIESVASGTARGAFKAQAFSLTLLPDTEVPFTLPPRKRKKEADAKRFGAIVAFSAPPKAGTFQVTLSGEAWIDLVQDGKSLKSADHSGVKDCPGLRKSVRFAVGDAPVVLQISGASEESIKVAITSVD
jgi:hypothetical protein